MSALIHANLTRQFKALELLQALLDEEFSLLQQRDTEGISTLEFSIHELLRQIVGERLTLKGILQETTLLEYTNLLPEEDGASIRKLYHLIDAVEQQASRQAAHNAELSLALMDQSQALLRFFHEQIVPKSQHIYGAKGQLRESRPDASLITGRL